MCLVERSGFGLNALLGPKVGLGHGNTLLPEERELIKVASLEDDLVVAHMEETAPTPASWITPFKNGPFSVLEDVLDYVGHGYPTELNPEHLSDRLTNIQSLHHHFVTHCFAYVYRCTTNLAHHLV